MLLFVCVTVALLFTFYLYFHNWNRAHQQNPFQLQPNCLLTRSPIVFLSGRRSLFYFLNYWNGVPHYLREHGYEVEELNLAWRDEDLRFQQSLNYLQQQKKPVHLIGDLTSLPLLTKLASTQTLHKNHLHLITTKAPSLMVSKNISHYQIPAASKISLKSLPWKILIKTGQFFGFNKNFCPTLLATPNLTKVKETHTECVNFAITLAESDL